MPSTKRQNLSPRVQAKSCSKWPRANRSWRESMTIIGVFVQVFLGKQSQGHSWRRLPAVHWHADGERELARRFGTQNGNPRLLHASLGCYARETHKRRPCQVRFCGWNTLPEPWRPMADLIKMCAWGAALIVAEVWGDWDLSPTKKFESKLPQMNKPDCTKMEPSLPDIHLDTFAKFISQTLTHLKSMYFVHIKKQILPLKHSTKNTNICTF